MHCVVALINLRDIFKWYFGCIILDSVTLAIRKWQWRAFKRIKSICIRNDRVTWNRSLRPQNLMIFYRGTGSLRDRSAMVCIQTTKVPKLRISWEPSSTWNFMNMWEYLHAGAALRYMRAHESFNQTRDTWYWAARSAERPSVAGSFNV